MPHRAPFVWTDAAADGVNHHVYFRFAFTLEQEPRKAVIHLFADANYHLRVNGVFVAYGPVRFYPEYPEYDTHDLAPLLAPGRNVIAVHALGLGMATFHHIHHRAGFTAWGEIVPRRGRAIRLDTPGEWRCINAPGYERDSPKFSFTSAPIQVLDERKAILDWDRPRAASRGWRKPVVVGEQDGWGKLRPRSIPALTQDELVPRELLSAHAHTGDERIYSFRLCNPVPGERRSSPERVACACTYIHSPRAQKVVCGLYWGEHYLNGRAVRKRRETDACKARNDAVLDLRKGWNFFFVKRGLNQRAWDFHLSVPVRAGLRLCADKRGGRDATLLVAGPFEATDPCLKQLRPRALRDAAPALSRPWRKRRSPSLPVLPAKHLAWIGLGPDCGLPRSRVRDLAVPRGGGRTFIFDMGNETLGRIFVEYEAPRGTVLDVGFSERLVRGRPEIMRRVWVYEGERQIAAGGKGRFETFFPRGLRYLQVTVVNPGGAAVIRRVGVVQQIYPHALRGAFACSDPLLDRVWEIGWQALRFCSEDVYTDCPWRERSLYGGDMFVEGATALVTSGDTRLLKRSIELIIQSQSRETGWMQSMCPQARDGRPLYDYQLITLLAADWLARLTGDRAFARRCYGPFRVMMEQILACRDQRGLFSSDVQPFIDHSSVFKDGCSTQLNALTARCLEAMAGLAGMLGRGRDAARYARFAGSTAAALRRLLWDEERGAFCDSLLDGRRIGQHHLQSGAWASVCGYTTPAQERRLRTYYREMFDAYDGGSDRDFITPYGAFFLLGGLYAHGHEDLAEEFMRRFWGLMVAGGADTTWEHFTPDKSRCHAWSSAPTYYLCTRALGVRLGFPEALDPGRLLIAPQSHDLAWARGRVPHPLGPVSVAWRVDGPRLRLEYEAPRGTRVLVRPQGRLAGLELWVNGRRYRG